MGQRPPTSRPCCGASAASAALPHVEWTGPLPGIATAPVPKRCSFSPGGHGNIDAHLAHATSTRLIANVTTMSGRPASAIIGAAQKARQFGKRASVHLALELDDSVDGHPIVLPSPRFEFSVISRTKTDVTIVANQPEKKPDLFLSSKTPRPTPPASYELIGDLIPQPVPRSSQHFDMLWEQTGFLM